MELNRFDKEITDKYTSDKDLEIVFNHVILTIYIKCANCSEYRISLLLLLLTRYLFLFQKFVH